MGRRGLHPAAVARTTREARRGRALVERLAMLAPALVRRLSAWILALPASRARAAVIRYVYRRVYAAYNRGDWEFNTLLLDPTGYELDAGDAARITPDAEPTYRGVDGYLAATALWAEVWDDPAIRFEDFVEIEPGRTLVALIRFVARGTGSGMTLDQPMTDIHTFRNGMAVAHSTYFDRAAGLRAAGLDPTLFAGGRRRALA